MKLGLDRAIAPVVVHEPESYSLLVPAYYAGLGHALSDTADWIHAFYMRRQDLVQEFPSLKTSLQNRGQLWVSWPKKTSGIGSDLNDAVVRDIGLAHGLVDVKVVAIDDTWSAIKFVYRLKDR